MTTLAKLFGDQPEIMIELYNKPFSPTCARGAFPSPAAESRRGLGPVETRATRVQKTYCSFNPCNTEVWERNFGRFAADYPLIADEWETNMRAKVCDDPPERAAEQFLQFLSARRIGLVVWSIDLSGTMVNNRKGRPNTFVGFKCGMTGGGAGVLVRRYFAVQDSHRR